MILRRGGAVVLPEEDVLHPVLHEGDEVVDVAQQLGELLGPDVHGAEHRAQLGQQPQQVHGAVQLGHHLARVLPAHNQLIAYIQPKDVHG